VARWRRAQALARTLAHRPDLIEAAGGLSDDDRELLRAYGTVPEVPAPDAAAGDGLP
jgi:tRNA (guanine37-N1)-methyltransferase